VQGKLLRELGMFELLQDKIKNGLPVFGTCAGLILLAQELSNDEHVYFGTLPVRVQRNAYGRQLGSFHTEQYVKGIGNVPMTFIRAPYIEAVGINGTKDAEILAVVDERVVAVRYHNQLGVAFHPELDADNRIHERFLKMCG
jgi:5'-phosphate synthase pdxT subunit